MSREPAPSSSLGPSLIIAALMLTLGCFRTHGDRPEDDVDLGPERDLGRLERDSGPLPVDAFVCPPDLGPPSPEIRITAEEAECVGLTAPDCAHCHIREDGWVLRPTGPMGPMPLPPPGGGVLEALVMECIPSCRFD